MNKNVSRIAAAFGATAMVALGTAGFAGAQDATSTAPTSDTTAVDTTSSSTPTTTQDETPKTTPSTTKDNPATAEGKLPAFSITEVRLEMLDTNGKVINDNATVKDIKEFSGDSATVMGHYSMRIPASAKTGDTLEITFFNGENGDWKQNLRNIKDDSGKDIATVKSEDGQTYTIELLNKPCGTTATLGFTLASNINGAEAEGEQFEYTKATPAPEGYDWEDADCPADTETKTVTPRPSTSTSPTTTNAPIVDDNNDAAGAGTPGEPGGLGGEGTPGAMMTPVPGTGTGAVSDSQTVVSGGGFTDSSDAHIPKWNKSPGGESISVDDDTAGPEVNTGGAVENASFFAKVVNLFR